MYGSKKKTLNFFKTKVELCLENFCKPSGIFGAFRHQANSETFGINRLIN